MIVGSPSMSFYCPSLQNIFLSFCILLVKEKDISHLLFALLPPYEELWFFLFQD